MRTMLFLTALAALIGHINEAVANSEGAAKFA